MKRVCRYIRQTICQWIILNENRRQLVADYTVSIGKNSFFEGLNKIHSHTYFNGHIGYGSYISNNCSINAKIGRYCSIASWVSVVEGMHPYKLPYVTTCPMFFSTAGWKGVQNGTSWVKEQRFEEYRFAEGKYPVVIENDVWIGANVLMISGIHIHNGAVILAGAVVTKDVPAYAIVGGVPASVIDYRFDQETINLLLDKKWWDKDPNWLKEHTDIMVDMDKFKSIEF